jgi:hypothetical protein
MELSVDPLAEKHAKLWREVLKVAELTRTGLPKPFQMDHELMLEVLDFLFLVSERLLTKKPTPHDKTKEKPGNNQLVGHDVVLPLKTPLKAVDAPSAKRPAPPMADIDASHAKNPPPHPVLTQEFLDGAAERLLRGPATKKRKL